MIFLYTMTSLVCTPAVDCYVVAGSDDGGSFGIAEVTPTKVKVTPFNDVITQPLVPFRTKDTVRLLSNFNCLIFI